MATNRSQLAPSLWIYNPVVDLMVGCGAWSVPLLGFAYLTASSNTMAWSVGFYGLALFFNYPHYMATIYRAYHRAEDFHKYRIFTVHITGLIALTLLLSHFWFRALPFIFTLYLCWSPWHYSGQNYGLLMMFARRAGARPSDLERRSLYGAFILSFVILIINFHTGRSNDPLFLSVGIPQQIGSVAVIVLGLACLALAAFGLSRLIAQTGWKPLLPSLTLFSTQFVWFLLPTTLSLVKGLQLPQSRYSTGVLAVMHSAQYLWITSYYARREASNQGPAQWRPFAYFGILILGGIALFVPGPWLASRIFHYDFTSSFLIFTALVNIHHFILDGAIWKLRDGRIASLLLNSQQRISDASARAGGQIVSLTRWLSGSTPLARSLQVSLVILLVAIGGVDQIRYYLALHSENLSDLQLAAQLDASDATLQSRLAKQELDAGDVDGAIAHWQTAVDANPSAAGPRDALLQTLSGKGRYDDAYAVSTRALGYHPDDVNLLVNAGVLARQLGHSQSAIDDWTKATSLDSSQPNAQLYLAAELDHNGKPGDAIPHYVQFLDQVSTPSRSAAAVPPASQIVPIILQLAQCQSEVNQPQQAERSYELARRVAAKSQDAKLQGLVDSVEADFQAGQNHMAAALALHQEALRLDASLDDTVIAATDWYNYGTFLRDNKFPDRLTFACFWKAELMLRANTNASAETAEQLKSVAQSRADLESTLSKQSANVKANLQSALDEALILKPLE